MPKPNGGNCITYTNGKRSHLVIVDPKGRFTNDTTVQSVVDAGNGLIFNVRGKVVQGSRRLKIAIDGTRVAPAGPLGAAAPGPDCGDLTVTLTDASGGAAGPDVNPVPVEYIEDTF
jgi:hypothetical protein